MADIALPIDAVGGVPQFPAKQERVADASLMQGRSDRALGAVSGIRPGADPVVTITSGRAWTVTPTNGVIDPGTASDVGPYLFAFTANKTGVLDAADANFTRYDRIDIQVPDDPAGASPLAPVYVITKGAAQANPQVPAQPDRTLQVGYFTVPNSGNPSFTPTYPYCASSGGIIPTRAGYRPPHPYKGQYIDDAAIGLLKYDGANWVRSYLNSKYCKMFNNINLTAGSGGNILDTGVMDTPFDDCAHLVTFSTYVSVQTLVANIQIGILIRFLSDTGAEIRRMEFEPQAIAAASTVNAPLSARCEFAAGANYRVMVDLIRRGGAAGNNISATPAYQSVVTDECVTMLP